MTIEELGKEIAKIRKEQRVTQAKLAESTSIHSRTIQNIEKGNFPTNIDNLITILNALNYEIKLVPKFRKKERVEVERYELVSKRDAEKRYKAGESVILIGSDVAFTDSDELEVYGKEIEEKTEGSFAEAVEMVARECNWVRRSMRCYVVKK